MLIFFNTDPDVAAAGLLKEKIARSLPETELEFHGSTKRLAERLRRRTHDIDMLLVVISDISGLSELEQIRGLLKDLCLVLVVSHGVGQQTARLYRLYPRSVLLLGEETGWIVDFVRNKMQHLKKGREENV
ncbi:MAG: hypothetical protein ACLFUN_07440 [Desulfobacterales bacterium]